MHLEFKPQGLEDLKYWAGLKPSKARKIVKMIEEQMDDFAGGWPQPQPLKNELTGWLSKPIDEKHRLVFRKDSDSIVIAQARTHH